MIKAANCIVCDDVRQETTGKVILVGVYGSDMILRQTPPANATVGLYLWVEFESSESVAIDLRAAVEGVADMPSDTIAYGVSVNLQNAVGLMQQTWGNFPCRIDFAHALRFEYRVAGGEWQFMRRLHIRHLSGATSEAAPA